MMYNLVDSLISKAFNNKLINITQPPVVTNVIFVMVVSLSMLISTFFSLERVLYPANRSGHFLTANPKTIKIPPVSKPPNII